MPFPMFFSYFCSRKLMDCTKSLPKEKTKTMKKLSKGIKWTAFPVAICLIGTMGANLVVNCAAKGRIYDNPADVPHHEMALLLGTTPINKKGNPSSYYVNRMEAAAQLYHAGKYDRIIVSGGVDDEFNEPESMRADLIRRSVPDSVIIMDDEGDRTIYSIERAKKVFHADSILIISQEFHNKRAIYQAQHFDLDAVAFNAADSPYRSSRIKNHLREYFARVKAILEVGLNH